MFMSVTDTLKPKEFWREKFAKIMTYMCKVYNLYGKAYNIYA